MEEERQIYIHPEYLSRLLIKRLIKRKEKQFRKRKTRWVHWIDEFAKRRLFRARVDAKLIFPRFRSLFLTFVNGAKPDRGSILLCAPLRTWPNISPKLLLPCAGRFCTRRARILCDRDLCSNSNDPKFLKFAGNSSIMHKREWIRISRAGEKEIRGTSLNFPFHSNETRKEIRCVRYDEVAC